MTSHAAPRRMRMPIPAVLRENADYRRAFLGGLTSSLGTSMSTIAFPLLVLALGGGAVQAGSVATASLATRLAFRLPAGFLVDRWNRRTVVLVTDVVRMAVLAGVPVAAGLGVLRFPQLIAAAVTEGLASALFGPAASVLIRDVVSGGQLAEALGLDQAVQAATYLVGPAIGGALFAVDRAAPFAVDAASYAVSAVLLWRITLRPEHGRQHGAATEASGMTAGIRWLLSHRDLLNILVYASAINLVSAAIEVLVVIDLRAHGEPGGQIGVILSCAGVGAIAGSLLAPFLVARLGVPAILLGIGAGWTLALAAFGLSFSPWQTAALLMVLMTLSPAAGVVVGHALFSQCPRRLVGRVSAATSVLLSGLAALGPILAGALFQFFGAAHGWLILSGVTAAVTVAAWIPLRASREVKSAVPDTPEALAGDALDAVDEDLFEVVAHARPPEFEPEFVSPAGSLGFHEPFLRLRPKPRG